jgi:hypothetical protein
VAGFCECGNESWGSENCGGISGVAKKLLASQEGIRYIEFRPVRYCYMGLDVVFSVW